MSDGATTEASAAGASSTGAESARAVLERALALLRAGEDEGGLRLLAEAAGEPATRLEALGHRAWFFLCGGRPAQAMPDLDALLVENTADSFIAAKRAEALLQLGRDADARHAAIDVLHRDPEQALALDVLVAATPRRHGSSAAAHLARINPVLVRLHHGPNTRPTSIAPGIASWLYDFVRLLRPVVALETGTFIGFSSIVIAQALADNAADASEGRDSWGLADGERALLAGAHLHCFDLFLDLDGYRSPVTGATGSLETIARSHQEAAGVAARITRHAGPSAPTIEATLAPGSVDFAFIDGDHFIDGALADWRAVDRVLKVGGFVLLHDTDPERSGWMGPRALLAGLQQTGRYAYPAMHLPTPDGCGLGLIQKQSSEPIATWTTPMMARVAQRMLSGLMPKLPIAWEARRGGGEAGAPSGGADGGARHA